MTTPDKKQSRFLLTALPDYGGSATWDYQQGIHFFSISDFAQEVIDGAALYLTDVIEAQDDSDLVGRFLERFDLHSGEAAIIFVRDWGFGEYRWKDRRYFSDHRDPIDKMRDSQ